MTELILLVVAAAWLAVLIPPMLRSRVENRPNSSVTDFRRQLTKLQASATPPRGAVRAMGRPLAQSPLSRPAAAGRPGQPVLRSGLTRQPSRSEIAAQGSTTTMPARTTEPADDAPRYRTHGDPSGGERRPTPRDGGRKRAEGPGEYRRVHTERDDPRPATHTDQTARRRAHGDATGGRGRPAAPAQRTPAKQRRTNVLFMLAITSVCALFLAVTTGSTVMLYGFLLVFLALSGYIYLLGQSRQRAADAPYDNWLD